MILMCMHNLCQTCAINERFAIIEVISFQLLHSECLFDHLVTAVQCYKKVMGFKSCKF